ncbi:MAG: GNAT family protein [Myxococcota bacterium]
MQLTDGTIRLRPAVEEDAPEVTAAVQASWPELFEWQPWAIPTFDQNDALRWIRGDLDPTEHAFVILGPDEQIAGVCGLGHINEVNRFANLGVWLRSDRTRRGWATAAVRLVVRYGFEELGLHRVELLMATGNAASRRLAERLGAHHEGVLRGRLLLHGVHHDAHLFAILAGERD